MKRFALLFFFSSSSTTATYALGMEQTRRAWLATVSSSSSLVVAVAANEQEQLVPFRSKAFGQEEYTNSITASRDTNLSPAEAYDTIRQHIPLAGKNGGRALDLGAGAGLSTQLLWDAGYTTIDAVDWSADAWESSVQSQPDSVRFYELADQEFFDSLSIPTTTTATTQRYDCIVYNFAVNPDKAIQVAQRYLQPSGCLLAPVNDRRDYWYKQTYWLLDAQGQLVWKSAQEVGAWSVQFQPDVTSPTCTGIWCGSFNGFEQQKRRRAL
jgi:SAM-dependent methyltransferase